LLRKRKKCKICKKYFPLLCFYKNGKYLSPYCKKCHNKFSINWRKNNIEKVRKSEKIWKRKNKDKVKYWNKIGHKNYKTTHPWIKTFNSIETRCNNPKCASYIYYGGKGIKNFLKPKDLEYLWFRDKAYLMKRPSIDRKNSNSYYTVKNCRYIELSKNVIKRHIPKTYKKRKDK
jgi:hypothetical protein